MTSFQSQYNSPYTPQYMMPNSSNINWVQGIEGAKAFQLMPNSNVILMDSETENVFYIKSSDNVGMCTMRTFKYEEVKSAPKHNEDLSNYVTKDELSKAIDDLKGVLNEQLVQKSKQLFS